MGWRILVNFIPSLWLGIKYKYPPTHLKTENTFWFPWFISFEIFMTWGHLHVTRNVVSTDFKRRDMLVKGSKWEVWLEMFVMVWKLWWYCISISRQGMKNPATSYLIFWEYFLFTLGSNHLSLRESGAICFTLLASKSVPHVTKIRLFYFLDMNYLQFLYILPIFLLSCWIWPCFSE
jgi:hypothetical protein